MEFDFLGRPIQPKKARGVKAVSDAPEEVRRSKIALLNRAKRSERDFAKWLVKYDGPDQQLPRSLTTSTGRIGHITAIQADCLSRSYVGENKNEQVPVKLARWWQQVCQVALDFRREPVLRWQPPNAKDYPVAGKPLPIMHVITEDRHEELLRKEQEYDAVAEDAWKYRELRK